MWKLERIHALPSRRWLRFSLRTMFALLTAFCVWLGWQSNIVRQRKAVLADNLITQSVLLNFENGHNKSWKIRMNRPQWTSNYRLSFWRHWMGDSEFVVSATINERTCTREEIGKIKRLFPETVFFVETKNGSVEGSWDEIETLRSLVRERLK